MPRSVRETDREAAVLRRVLGKRRPGRLDGAVLLRRHVLDADAARVSAQGVRPDISQVPDATSRRTGLHAVRRHPSGERRLEGPVRQARLQEVLRDGARHLEAAPSGEWERWRRRRRRRGEA